ncbi:hypothetical protein BJX96DRAFT_166419 [Aspergillus floccosus]
MVSPSEDTPPPSTSTSTDVEEFSRTLVRLPAEIKDKILSELDLSNLSSVARVCRSFHEQAAPRLYRAISHTFYPGSAMDEFFSWQRFTSFMERLLASTHDYAQHVREITIGSMDGSDVLGSPLYAATSPIKFSRNRDTLDYFLVQLLDKAVNLAIFRWDLNVELSPSLLLALERLSNLQSLHVRLSVGPMSQRVYATSSSEDLEANTQTPASMVPSSSPILPVISGLKTLTILDIPSLDCIPEVAKCISSSSCTLKTLQVSSADALALKKSRFLPPLPNATHHNDDQGFDFNDIFGSYSDDEEDDEDQPVIPEELRPTPAMLREITAQEQALTLLFDFGLSVPAGDKSIHTSISNLTVHDSRPSSSTRVDTVSLGDSSVSSVGPASLVLSGPSNARTSMSSMFETAGGPVKPNAKSIKEYVRAAHGLPVERLYLYQVPVTTSTLTSGVDLSSIRHLSLLTVGPQDDIWAAMNQRHAYTPYNLVSIHTDHVVPSFLDFVHNLSRLCELFILERSHRSTLHTSHLERLVIRHDETSAWDLDPATAALLTFAPKLAELAVTVNFDSYNVVIHNLHNMTSLRALQIFWHHKLHYSPALRRELAFLADLIICHPMLAIEYDGMGHIRSGPVTNCIVHVPARLAQLRDMRDGYVSDPEVSRRSSLGRGSRVYVNESPLTVVPDEVFARSSASGFDVEEIVGVKMWEPRTWNLKL